MSPNKNYYSASEKDRGIKALRIVLCILLVAVLAIGVFFTVSYIKKLEKEHTVSGEKAKEQTYSVNVLICVRV